MPSGGGRQVLPLTRRKEISGRIRELMRVEFGGVQYRLAKKTGLPRATVSGWLDPYDPATPDAPALIQLAATTGVSLDWLLMERGDEMLYPVQKKEPPLRQFVTKHDAGPRLNTAAIMKSKVTGDGGESFRGAVIRGRRLP